MNEQKSNISFSSACFAFIPGFLTAEGIDAAQASRGIEILMNVIIAALASTASLMIREAAKLFLAWVKDKRLAIADARAERNKLRRLNEEREKASRRPL